MKLLKKWNAALALALTLTLVSPAALPTAAVTQAEAATIKINATKKTLKVGKSYQLKITGTKKTVTWKSSKTSVATVTKKGKVTAKAAGKANITAKVDNKKFVCKITVKDSANPALENAPFDASEVKAEGYSFVVPKAWENDSATSNGIYTYAAAPSKQNASNIIVMMQAANMENVDYSAIKEVLAAQFTEDAIKATLESQGFVDTVVSNFNSADVKTPVGTAYYISYDVSGKMQGQDINLSQYAYLIPAGDHLIGVTGTEFKGEEASPSIKDATDYLAQSLMKQD